jgi:transcriptional regulator with XRE-family HTH domain
MTFGSMLRKLRYRQGIGIKRLAPELDVDYTYLSRLENDKAAPSEEVIDRISRYFNQDKDELMLLADKVPEDVKQILRENPREALEYLRERFAEGGRQG